MDPNLPSPTPQHSKNYLWLIILLSILSLLSTFIGGYYLNILLKSEVVVATPVPISERPEKNTIFLPGKQYFDDTVMAFTENEPRKILIATVTRQEKDNGVSYFDGTKWTRKVSVANHETSEIYTNNIVSSWKIDIDPSRVLKQSVSGKITLDQTNLDFNTGMITNNIGVRSLPGYTKFMSTGIGSLVINGVPNQVKILYDRIYSSNSKDIQFYDSPLGLTTHWVAFWDTTGNFFHVDSTTVDNPTQIYQTHQIGVKVDTRGGVFKTFLVEVQPSKENPPQTYTIKFGEPMNQILSFKSNSSLNKDPGNENNWFMSYGLGSVDGISGFGAIEYIHN